MLREALALYQPEAAGGLVSSLTCLYTVTPDKHLIVDRDWEQEQDECAVMIGGAGIRSASWPWTSLRLIGFLLTPS